MSRFESITSVPSVSLLVEFLANAVLLRKLHPVKGNVSVVLRSEPEGCGIDTTGLLLRWTRGCSSIIATADRQITGCCWPFASFVSVLGASEVRLG